MADKNSPPPASALGATPPPAEALPPNTIATIAWLDCKTDDERKACVKKYPQLVTLHSGASNFV